MKLKSAEKLSVGVAVLAIILSQFKPLHEYLGSPNMKFNLGPFIIVDEQAGYFSFMSRLNIENSGEKEDSVNKIDVLILQEDSDYLHSASVVGYHTDPDSLGAYEARSTFMFNRVLVKPKQYWEKDILINNMNKNSNIDYVSQIDYWHERFNEELGKYDPREEPMPVSDNLFNDFSVWHNKLLEKFPSGKFYALFVFYLESSGTEYQLYRFNVDKHHLENLKKKAKIYRYGEGIARPRTSGYTINSNLIKVSDKKISKRIYKLYLSEKND